MAIATYSYQELFMLGINQVIVKLINDPQPASDPARTAWEWFKGSNSPQDPQVNAYMSTQINAYTMSKLECSPIGNWEAWEVALNDVLSSPSVPTNVAEWLKLRDTERQHDLPLVPPDVIDWTKKNLPVVKRPVGV